MKRIQILALAGVVCLSAAALTACGKTESSNDSNSAHDSSNSALSGTVSTGGSTSMQKLMSMMQEDFMAQHRGVTVTYDPTGSGAGIAGAGDGSLDIGLSSRALRNDETNVEVVPLCLDGIAVVVNLNNPVENLTLSQLADIYTGTITNWSEVGGNDAPIVVVGREAGSGTRDGFETAVGVEEECRYHQELTATGAVTAAVLSNQNAIGYASLSAVNEGISSLMIDGVACTEETVKNGTYSIQRPFHFVIKKGAVLSDAAQAFLTYATNGSANAWIEKAGCIALH